MTIVLPSGIVSANAYVKSHCESVTVLLSNPVHPVYSVIISRALNSTAANSPRSAPGGFEVCLTMSLFALSYPACRRFRVTRSTGSASHARLNSCLSAVVDAKCKFCPPVISTLLSHIFVAVCSVLLSCAVFV